MSYSQKEKQEQINKMGGKQLEKGICQGYRDRTSDRKLGLA